MQVLYGTNNPGKLKRIQAIFRESNIDIVGPQDLGIQIDVEETGQTPLENARLKAKAFYAQAGTPTFAVDSGLYLDKLPADKQPGVFVRRVNGVELNDEEMFVYYQNLLVTLGGRSPGYWLDWLVLIDEGGQLFENEYREETFLTAEASLVEILGQPISALEIDPELNQYKTEITPEQRLAKSNRFDRRIYNFLTMHLETSDICGLAREFAREQMEKNPVRDRLNRSFRDRWAHTNRVLSWAKRLQKEEGGDWEMIELATWLHDCGYDRARPHAEIAAEKASKFFAIHPYDRAEDVISLVRNHSRKEEDLALSVEMRVLMDADTLDEKGALAVLLDAMSEVVENPHACYEDVYGRILRYFPEVRREARRLKTEAGKRIFNRKIQWMEGCIAAIREELGE
ncbi:hypothetical protein SANA_04310 [Gottschalkiaceae bacterium SANA]|nr:hypothetical protein SANA_04310 [Gottschalkiaceae bacterium SANA]